MGLFPDGLPSAVPAPKRPRFHRRLGRLLPLALWSALGGVLVACFAAPFVLPPSYAARQAVYAWEDLPTALPLDAELPQRSVLTDDAGKTFAVFYGQNRIPLRLAQVSPTVVDALLATEDDHFYEHGAVDLKGLARAVLRNGQTGSTQGASGITQQYVKNLLLTQATSTDQERAVTEQTLIRKMKELRLAVELEKKLTKDQILERYLNTVNFGDGAYGIGAAARHYFAVDAKDLTVVQAATLVGILKSPTNYNPVDKPERSLLRRDVVLARMHSTGRITDEELRDGDGERHPAEADRPGAGLRGVGVPVLLPVRAAGAEHRRDVRGHARGARRPALPRRARDPHDAEPRGDGGGADRGRPRAHADEPGRDRHRRRATRHRRGRRARHEQAVGT